MRPYVHKKWILLALAIVLPLGAWALADFGSGRLTVFLASEATRPYTYILLFILLPIFGFPILPLLVLMGAKFGAVDGTVLVFCSMPFHLVVSYLFSNSLLHPYLSRFAARKGFNIARIPEEKLVTFSFLFMLIPGPSYAMKNYLLPLSGIPFVHYFIITLLTQGGLGIPFIIAGEAVDTRKLLLPMIALLVAGAVYILLLWIKNRNRKRFPWEDRGPSSSP